MKRKREKRWRREKEGRKATEKGGKEGRKWR